MLSVSIKQNQEIKGINIGNENDLEIKVVQLVDDTNLLVKDKNSVLKAKETVNAFSDVAGVRLNENKTEGIWLGQRAPIIDPNVIKWASRPIKILRGVEWVHGLFLFPLVLGKMYLPHAKLGLFV